MKINEFSIKAVKKSLPSTTTNFNIIENEYEEEGGIKRYNISFKYEEIELYITRWFKRDGLSVDILKKTVEEEIQTFNNIVNMPDVQDEFNYIERAFESKFSKNIDTLNREDYYEYRNSIFKIIKTNLRKYVSQNRFKQAYIKTLEEVDIDFFLYHSTENYRASDANK